MGRHVLVLILILCCVGCSEDSILGSSCETNGDCQDKCDDEVCAGWRCVAADSGGFCTKTCSSYSSCEDGTCARIDGREVCAPKCSDTSDCRDNAICTSDLPGIQASKDFCAPRGYNPALVGVGDACEANGDCGRDLTCRVDWPGGYCTRRLGPSSGACGVDAIPVRTGDDGGYCHKTCTTNTDCRGGYQCTDMRDGRRACTPGVYSDDLGKRCASDRSCALPFTCGPEGVCEAGCETSMDCGPRGLCVNGSYSYKALPDGASGGGSVDGCVLACLSDGDCPNSMLCESFGNAPPGGCVDGDRLRDVCEDPNWQCNLGRRCPHRECGPNEAGDDCGSCDRVGEVCSDQGYCQ